MTHYRLRYVPGSHYEAQCSNDGQKWSTIKRVSTKYGQAKQWASNGIKSHRSKLPANEQVTWHTEVVEHA